MFKQRHNKDIDSRVRFMIQDLIESYERDWKQEIFFVRRNETDTDGFQKKYVPKGSKIAQDAQKFNKAGHSDRRSSLKEAKDSKKSQAAAQAQQATQGAKDGDAKKKSMYQLL